MGAEWMNAVQVASRIVFMSVLKEQYHTCLAFLLGLRLQSEKTEGLPTEEEVLEAMTPLERVFVILHLNRVSQLN